MRQTAHTQLVSGNTRPQSSQLAEPLWTDPDIKSGISVHELISTSKTKTEKRRRGMMAEHSIKILASEEKKKTLILKTTRQKRVALAKL